MGKEMNKKYCLSSKDIINATIKQTKKKREDFEIDSIVILFFSKSLIDYLKKNAKVTEIEWLSPYHPYGGGNVFRIEYNNINFTAISPPMGASPIASVIEDAIFLNAKMILLVCGSWGIGKKVKLLDFLIPTYTLGPDGTSIHYGRNIEEEIEVDKDIVELLTEETKNITNNFHNGKNYSKEAFYRINEEEIQSLRKKGIISMENGELNVLATLAKQNGVKFGAIFYSYYNPLEGWKIPWLDVKYKNCVYRETEIILKVLEHFM